MSSIPPPVLKRAFTKVTSAANFSSSQFNKLLVVHKISRLTRFQRQGVLLQPYIEKYYKQALETTHMTHHGVINTFVEQAKKMGKEVVLVPEDELDKSAVLQDVFPETDMVVSMGGDHTFLRAQALIQDRKVPIMGINTCREKFEGVLNTQHIDYEERLEQATKLLEKVEDESAFSYEKRSRILFEQISSTESEEPPQRVLCLNETLCAEKDVSSASRYVVERDGMNVGPFKSSGLVVSTGTGSTGWLYSVRQITPQQLEQIQNLLGSMEGEASMKMNEQLALELSNETIFPRDKDAMYYCVREGFSFTTGESEGFAKRMSIRSDMIDGQAVVDGWFKTDLSLGDTFTLTADPKFALKVINVSLHEQY